MLGFSIRDFFNNKRRKGLCLARVRIIWSCPMPARPWISLRWRPPATCVYLHHLKDFGKNIIKIYLNRRIDPQYGRALTLCQDVAIYLLEKINPVVFTDISEEAISFQSMIPARGETRPSAAWRLSRYFNPRSLRGERRIRFGKPYEVPEFQSTLA